MLPHRQLRVRRDGEAGMKATMQVAGGALLLCFVWATAYPPALALAWAGGKAGAALFGAP